MKSFLNAVFNLGHSSKPSFDAKSLTIILGIIVGIFIAIYAMTVGPNDPVGTPSGSSPRVRTPQCSQVRQCNRYSSTSGSTFGRCAT